MKLNIWRAIAAGLSVLAAALPSHAASCAGASLASYLALGSTGCTVGALTFSDFVVDVFPGPTAQQIAPGSLSITPIAGGFALSSSSAIDASAGDLFGLRLLFDVSAPSLLGGTVDFGASRAVSGDGALSALFDAGASGTAIAIVIDGFEDTPESFSSAAVGSYAAFLELGIDGGTGGSASLGPDLASLTFAVGNVVTPVPEPEIAWLLLPGLLAVLVRRRRPAGA